MPAAASSSMSAWISAFAPTSTPRVGSSRIRIGHRAASHFVSTIFCWLPPESAAAGVSRPRRLHAQPLEVRLRRRLLDRAGVMNPSRASRGRIDSVALSSTFIDSTSPCRLRSSGTRPMPSAIARAAPSMPQRLAADRDRAASRADRARTAPAPPRIVPAPTSPAKPTTSPARTENDTSLKPAGLDSFSTRSTSSPALASDVRREVLLEPAADHHLDERRRGRATPIGTRGDVPAVAQHGDRVAQPEDLLEPVADVDAGDAALFRRVDQRVEPVGFVLRQAAGRLVEDDQPRALPIAAAICSICCWPIVSSPTGRVDVERRVDRRQHRRRRGAASRLREHEPRRASAASRGRGSRRPTGSRRTRAPGGPSRRRRRARRSARRTARRWPSISDPAGVRRVDAGEELAERALAGAVLAAERVARARGDLEADVVERDDPGKRSGSTVRRTRPHSCDSVTAAAPGTPSGTSVKPHVSS